MGFIGKDMRSSEFKDKQITELSRSHSDEFSEYSYELSKDDFDSSFSFHPKRPVASPTFQVDYGKTGSKKVGTFSDGGIISVIDLKMEEHFNNLLRVVEGLSARMRQLESRTQNIEHSVEELKESAEFSYGRTESKLRELGNIVTEVQGGIKDLRDKQEISQVQLQLAKLQTLKGYQQSKDRKTKINTSSSQGVLSSVQQHSNQSNPMSVTSQQQFPMLSSAQQYNNQSNPTFVTSQQHFPPNPNDPQTQSYQSLPPIAGQFSTQVSQNQTPSVSQAEYNYSPHIFSPESSDQQYCMPPIQQPQPTSAAPYQSYQPVLQLPLTSQLQPLPQLRPSRSAVDPQTYHSSAQNFEEMSYMSPQSYSTSIHKTYKAPIVVPPSQQFYIGSNQRIGGDLPSRSSEYHPEHIQPIGDSSFRDVYSHSGFPSHYSSSRMKSSELPPVSLGHDGENRFSQPPASQVLPHALPMASCVDSGLGSSGSGNSIPVDDVIDNIVAMGFRRDMVRATVKKMTENGQSVDPNVVLDKLMNNGEVQNESHRFGR
ncbi:hypothetical protein TorRG33x02_074050 [Trema orientale]|uniref:DUF1421 domain-containing protein n=1 Tax=Trema orientale TaxID=63057 RepID=A0A2P5FFZ4_TREOI|nr:hypothetical protein TorRG33x02_074050 [Trema orientale]